MINTDVIYECSKKKLPFPEVVKRLSEIGIERYYTDLIRMEQIFYSHHGESHIARIPIENIPPLDFDFNEKKVIELLRSVQNGEIDYPTFIRGIIAAGTVSYTVYIDGRQTLYAGRNGKIYTEKFAFI